MAQTSTGGPVAAIAHQQLWGAVPAGGHVVRHVAGVCRTRQIPRKPKVAQLEDARRRQEHVLRLNVPVHDLLATFGSATHPWPRE